MYYVRSSWQDTSPIQSNRKLAANARSWFVLPCGEDAEEKQNKTKKTVNVKRGVNVSQTGNWAVSQLLYRA